MLDAKGQQMESAKQHKNLDEINLETNTNYKKSRVPPGPNFQLEAFQDSWLRPAHPSAAQATLNKFEGDQQTNKVILGTLILYVQSEGGKKMQWKMGILVLSRWVAPINGPIQICERNQTKAFGQC